MSYKVKFSIQGRKDLEIVKKSPLRKKAFQILEELEVNPYKPKCEKLAGNLLGKYSKRLNIQHRIVYIVHEPEKIVVITAMWAHYDE